MQQYVNTPTDLLSNEQLSQLMQYFNDQYRVGTPVISDAAFDLIYTPILKKRIPNHPLLTKVQPESINALNTRYEHKQVMLSTNKAYEHSDIESFILRCQKAASELCINDDLLFRVTPKLDGLAASYIAIDKKIYTRGDGKYGNDISHLYANGLTIIGNADRDAVGEIVVQQDYFNSMLKEQFAHPRNFVAGLANSINLSDAGKMALKAGAVHLVFFKNIECPCVNGKQLLDNLDDLCEQAKHSLPYVTDGTVIEVINDKVKSYMSHNERHNHWQIAKKSVGEIAEVRVQGVEWAVGRNKITPVLLLEPTWLSGALIKRVTAHHAGNVKSLGLGEGALISMTRSGEIIPKIIGAIESVAPSIPTHCPCCNQPVQWVNDAITCTFDGCSERQVSAIEYHFAVLKADLFGRQTVRRMVANGYTSLSSVYSITYEQLLSCGFGEVQAKNLLDEINKTTNRPINDYLILASLGIHALGKGSSKKLLKHIEIDELNELSANQLNSIDGFGELTASSITSAITERFEQISYLISILNVIRTPMIAKRSDVELPLNRLSIVFTGKMTQSRSDMTSEAESLGAVVQSGVTKTTTYLVIGENVGATKINAAKAKGVEIISEAEYTQMISAL
ncbi:hypothetical protein H5202_07620 [Shewanella sp. SG41-4]|uniref:BRCT domain-containing protein n=1 Tax=Shewanella sp. SG41-4 TaxID=2760976 RepID=UPI001603AADF|nr:BRCT domain-containing protein [Shewanella sp. SG41-4]MBB1438559.1 hypothetical protein [Shewanella sp. SG41-4]